MNPSPQALTEIEERLGQPGGEQVLQDLRQALTEHAQALRRSMSSGTLDRDRFAQVSAYAQAFEAAHTFLGAVTLRSIHPTARSGMPKE